MRILTSLVLVAAACNSKTPGAAQTQSFHDGVQALCDLPKHVPEPDEPYDKRLAKVAEWAEQNITNAEAKQVGDVKSLPANKDALANAVAKAAIQHCLLLENGMELQSFADAMKLACEANKGAAYFKSHLLNAEVIRLVESVGDANPAERQQRLHDAMARAKLPGCALVDHADASPVPIPTVADAGLVGFDSNATLVITPRSIVVEGKAIVAVANGDVDPAEKEGGAAGVMIPRLRDFTKALVQELAKKPTPSPTLTLMIDPTTPYRLLVEALFSTKAAGIRTFKLAVRAGTAIKAIPLELSDKKPARPPGMPVPGLAMVVSVTKDHLLLWSISGKEGTLAKPLLDVAPDHFGDVQKALAAIVDKHWHDGKRAAIDREIVVMVDGAVPMQAVAEVLASVRATADGKELFPELRLSSGFE